MLRTMVSGSVVSRSTPRDLVWATELGARLAARSRRYSGRDGDSVRREILAGFRADFDAEGFAGPMQETLLAAARRGLDEAMA